jgi:serine protease Do
VCAPELDAQAVARSRDSTTAQVRVFLRGDSIAELINRLLQSRQQEEAVAMSLREARGDKVDVRRVDELRAQLTRIARENVGLITRIQLECVREDPMPEGWLGVDFVEARVTRQNDEPAVFELGERPTVLSVEPGSPAEKAGIQTGDLLMKIGGQDARRIALAPILKPGAHVIVTLQRDRAQREITVLIDKRPQGFGSDCNAVEHMIAPDGEPMMFMRTPGYPRMPPIAGSARGPAAVVAPDVPMPPMGGVLGYAFTPGGTTSIIAGASMMALDDDWKQQMGVDNGVLVMKVAPGSPARDAGLRSADVILSADGQAVSSVVSLRRIISNSQTNSVKLQIVRAGKTQLLTLRWDRER